MKQELTSHAIDNHERERKERMNIENRLDKYASEYHVVRGALHIAGKFQQRAAKNGGYETYFYILAVADSVEGLCIELDHIAALEEESQRNWKDREIDKALKALRHLDDQYASQEAAIDEALAARGKLGLWGRIKRYLRGPKIHGKGGPGWLGGSPG